MPCELIDYNGEALKALVLRYAALWALPGDFCRWVGRDNLFCSTLVDRIMTGYPAAEAAALLAFDRGKRDGGGYPLQDDEHALAQFAALWRQVDAREIPLADINGEFKQHQA